MLGIMVHTEGLDEAMAAIKSMQKTLQMAGSVARGVKLNEKQRVAEPGEPIPPIGTTRAIMVSLAEQGRDFFSLRSGEGVPLSRAFAAEFERRMAREARKKREISAARAGAIARAAFEEMMKAWMRIVSERLTSQATSGGGTPDSLSDSYADWKQRKYHFTTPIGVATGQLREQFDPSNYGNIALLGKAG